MKPYFILGTFLFLLSSCKTTEFFVETNDYKGTFLNKDYFLQAGKCYVSAQVSNVKEENAPFFFEKGFVLIYKEPIFKETSVYISSEEIEKHTISQDKVRLMIRPAYTELSIEKQELKKFISKDYPNAFMFCLREIPAEYSTFSIEKLKLKNFKIKRFEIVENPKIIKRNVNRKPRKTKPNQFYCSSGTWIELREALLPTYCPTHLVKDIKRKLIENGYTDLELNNQFDEKAKAAIIDFQKKHELEVGTLNSETLQKLGVSN